MSPQPNYFDVIKPEDLSIAHLWTHFAGVVLPLGASDGQRQDMRKAFYAGFIECFKIVNDASTKFEELHAAQILEKLSDEGHEFFNQIMKEHGPRR
jgi:hypothetical protein